MTDMMGDAVHPTGFGCGDETGDETGGDIGDESGDGIGAGLRGYAAAVGARLGVGLESCTIDPHGPASVYLALDDTHADFPDRDVALLWDERHGWALAIETHSGEDLIVLSYLGDHLLPTAGRVSRFARSVLTGEHRLGQPTPPALPPARRADWAPKLAEYLLPDW